MVYAYIQDVPIGEELYRQIIDKIGPEPIPGRCCTCVSASPTASCGTSTSGNPSKHAPGPSPNGSTPPSTPHSAATGPRANPSYTTSTS